VPGVVCLSSSLLKKKKKEKEKEKGKRKERKFNSACLSSFLVPTNEKPN